MATSNFARPSNASNYYVVLTNKEIEYKECSECGEIHNDWDFDLDKTLLCNSCGEELPETETRYDAPEEWDIDYLKENVINAIEAKGGYSINKWANERNYNYIELGCIEKSKVYGEVEVGVKVTAILQSAYYEGATLDFLVQVWVDVDDWDYSTGSFYDCNIDDILEGVASRQDYLGLNKGLQVIQRGYIENYLNNTISNLSETMDNLLADFSEHKLICQGVFSNGEAIYTEV